jgi:hypothetical protein
MPYKRFPPTRKAYKRYMLKNPGPEIKFIDMSEDVTPLTAGSLFNVGPGSTNTLCGCAQGDGPSDREGRKIKVIGIQFRGHAENLEVSDASPSNTDSHQFIRLVVYQDRQTNGAAPTIIDNNTGILTSVTPNIHGLPCMYTRGRFRIIVDKQWTFNAFYVWSGAACYRMNNIKAFKFFKKLSIPVEFDNSATTGALSTIRTNNVNAFAIQSASSQCKIVQAIRTFFIDDC